MYLVYHNYSNAGPECQAIVLYVLTDQNFTNNFLKGSPKEHFREITLKSDLQFQRRFFKEFLHVTIAQVAIIHQGHLS